MTTVANAKSVQPAGSSLLDPALAAVARMELVAQQVMDGYVQGIHRSPHIGFALDFAQHRQYAPGDDIKRIDWRVYAKQDRYYIKQYEVTTNLKAHLLVDASASMAYRGKDDPMSKFRYAQFIATCLAYLILHQQDSVGLVTFDTAIRQFIPARSASPHLFTIARTLDATIPAGESSLASVLHDIAERLGHRQMVIVLSDFFDNTPQLLQSLHHLRHKRHEVLLLQILSNDELTFPFRSFSEFENLETQKQKIKLDPATVRAAYLANLARHLKSLRDECNALRISHALFKTTDSVEKSLSTYLAQDGQPMSALNRQAVKSSRRQNDILPVFSFEKLEVYQAARNFSRRLAKLAALLPSDERFRLKFQVEKARLSLTNAISEGHGRYTYKDRKHYCYEARGSLQELADDITECNDMNYAKSEHLADLKRDAFRVLQLIDGWARYLEKQRRASETKSKRSAPPPT